MVATASPGARASIVTTAIGNRAIRLKRGTGNRERKRLPLANGRSLPFAISGSRRSAAFTLIEMLAVIVLIAIGVTLTAVTLRGHDRNAVQAAAQRVAAGLRDTRTRAMATGKPQWFTLDVRTHTFAAPGRTPRGLPPDASVHVTSAAEGGTQPGIARIGYFPDGSSSGGNITLSEAHRSARVNVDWLTGAVTVVDGPTQ